MLLISAIFPLTLPPEYTPQAAAQTVSQPDWYFLWIYQVLKFQIFESAGLPFALGVVTIIFIVLTLLPFIDRGNEKSIGKRKKFVTLGTIFVAEVVTLSVWGELTPGRIIPTEQGVLVLGGVALLVVIGSVLMYKLSYRITLGRKTKVSIPAPVAFKRQAIANSLPLSRSASLWTVGIFAIVLGVATLSFGSTVNSLVLLVLNGSSFSLIETLVLSLAGIALSVFAIGYLIYRLELNSGSLKRRIRAFEVGWRKD